MNDKATLVVNYDIIPGVLRNTIKDLQSIGFMFEKIIIIYNYVQQTNTLSDDTKLVLQEFPLLKAEILATGFSDLLTKQQNLQYFERVVNRLNEEKQLGKQIVVNIAGGRKNMSALLLSAAYITGVKNIFHTLLQVTSGPDDTTIDTVHTIPIPHLYIDQILNRIVVEIDEENRFNGSVFNLIQELKTEEAFSRLNDYLDRQTYYRKLKEDYRNRVPVYESMLNATEMIMRYILKDNLMFPPTFEKRVKDFKSFYDKLVGKENKEGIIPDPFERIRDIAGLRIIFYNSSDMQKAASLLIRSGDFIDAKGSSNLIADDKSKSLGYRAIHFDVKLNPEKRLQLQEYNILNNISCEIQFKTIFAHSWSKVHHALAYKDNREKKLIFEEQQALDIDFKNAAIKLEEIEQQITKLCEIHISSQKGSRSN